MNQYLVLGIRLDSSLIYSIKNLMILFLIAGLVRLLLEIKIIHPDALKIISLRLLWTLFEDS